MVLDQENVFNFYQYLTQQNINSITIMKKIKFTFNRIIIYSKKNKFFK